MYVLQANDKEIKETKKRGRPGKPDTLVKFDKKIENGEPAAKRGRGRPKKSSSKSATKVSFKYLSYKISVCAN